MKNLRKALFFFVFFFMGAFVMAQNITQQTFMVRGECGMCKDRIEENAKKLAQPLQNGMHLQSNFR